MSTNNDYDYEFEYENRDNNRRINVNVFLKDRTNEILISIKESYRLSYRGAISRNTVHAHYRLQYKDVSSLRCCISESEGADMLVISYTTKVGDKQIEIKHEDNFNTDFIRIKELNDAIYKRMRKD
tara:strand:+ start:3087 stop:3464 length:378 start_codon:yes stop_codon:yes gene_type:complete